ncbi:MAG: hypothetical protein KDD51_09405 [Bdellovibrionales bacterium]|nr:hypothetical protein [Bdellovibrionales bacterium]
MTVCELKSSRAFIAGVGTESGTIRTALLAWALVLAFLFGLALKLSESPVMPLDPEPFARPHYSLGRML